MDIAMNRLRSSLALAATLVGFAAATAGSQQVQDGYVPPNGFVPNAATAAAVTEAVLIPVYGQRQIASERPFTARLEGNVWTVSGTLPRPMLGGVAVVRLSKRDGRILSMIHYQ